ncbi:helix-turn-helix domain-containing protein [Massilia sp. TWP1-3-3]|uniref:helix-turn-helix domain-containing protein n=1 Tax=Massilia sp. TWP1-3-3 TaxID=2804573 RepID=UPI003CFBAAEB
MAKDDDFTYQAIAGVDTAAASGHDSQAASTASTLHGDLKKFRISKRESQEKFWGRFGVTQSSGSRFETGLGIPPPVAILVKLYVKGRLSDGDLPG